MAASNPVQLPDWVVQSIDKEPSFRVLTMDGLGWIDPYTGTVTQAPFGHREVALRHLAASRPWITLKPKSLKELLYLRWLHYLRNNLEFIELLRVFRHGLWLNPYTGAWVPDITLVNNQITGQTIDDLAHVLGQCDEAQSGKMLERFRLDILIANGPEVGQAQQAKETPPKVAGKASRAKTDFHHVKNQFLKMLAKPPRLEGYQIVMQYEPHSIIPRNFYDFISLDRDRLMIVMGDLVGDGPGAALMVGQAMRSMRRLAAQRADLLDFFANLNDEIRVDLVHGCAMNVFAAVLNLPFNSLTCLSVGFHPVMLVNPRREITLQQIHTRGDPLGVTSGQQFRTGLRPLSLQLEAGDMVVMFTDGVARAHNARDLNAGRLAVMGSCVAHLEQSCGQMVARMLDEAKTQLGGRPTDDLSALALRVKHEDEPNSGGFAVVPTASHLRPKR